MVSWSVRAFGLVPQSPPQGSFSKCVLSALTLGCLNSALGQYLHHRNQQTLQTRVGGVVLFCCPPPPHGLGNQHTLLWGVEKPHKPSLGCRGHLLTTRSHPSDCTWACPTEKAQRSCPHPPKTCAVSQQNSTSPGKRGVFVRMTGRGSG